MITQMIYSNELEKRLDPHFYRPEFSSAINRLINSANTIKMIGDICDVVCGPFGSAIHFSDYSNNGVPLLRIENIKGYYGISRQNLVYIKEPLSKSLNRYKVNIGDVIISQRGTLGLCGVVDKNLDNSIISANLIALKNIKEALPEFIQLFLGSQYGQIQLRKRTSGQVQTKITTEDIKTILIPILPKEKQQIIINQFKSLLKTSENKLKIANNLNQSLSTFIQNELGIELTNKSISSFSVRYKEVQKGRIDPFYLLNRQSIWRSKTFQEKKLCEVARLTKGKSISKQNIKKGKYPVIAGGRTSPYTIDRNNVSENAITISASGAYAGFVWYHEEPIFASDCTVIQSLDEKFCSTFFLYCVLKAKQDYIYNLQHGAGQPHIYTSDISNLNIPLPDIQTQIQISKKIKQRSQKIEELKREAQETLLLAKINFEKTISI